MSRAGNADLRQNLNCCAVHFNCKAWT